MLDYFRGLNQSQKYIAKKFDTCCSRLFSNALLQLSSLRITLLLQSSNVEKPTFQLRHNLWECSSGLCHIITSLSLGPLSPLLPALLDLHEQLLEVVSRAKASLLDLVVCLYVVATTDFPVLSVSCYRNGIDIS